MKIGIAGPIEVNALIDYLDIKSDESLPKGLGGTAINNLVKGFIQMGHEVSVYTLDPVVTKMVLLQGPNLKVFIGRYRPSGFLRALTLFSVESLRISRMIKSNRPEIVSAHWGYEFSLGAILSGCRHLITQRDSPLKILKIHRNYYRFSRLFLFYLVKAFGKNFIANSPYLAKELGLESYIPNSIELKKRYRPKEIDSDHIRFISIIDGSKNPETSLKAFKIIKEHYPNSSYKCFGRGLEESSAIRKWSQENGLLEGVFFEGRKPISLVLDKLGDSHILIHPSLEESFGNTIIEALATGIPVIGGKSSGAVPWVLNYGKNGLLVDVTDEREIAEKSIELIRNRSLYKRLSLDGMNHVEKNFSNKAVCHKYLDLFEKVV